MIGGSGGVSLEDALTARYPHATERSLLIRQRLKDACNLYLQAGYGDGNAAQRLCSTNNAVYWQQLSEVLVAHQLLKAQIPVVHPRAGPDFVLEHDKRKIWLEVICPEASGIPDDWTNHVPGTVVNLPHESILLRWTAALKEKAEKLLGKPGQRGYLDKGIVGPNDGYVVVINGRLLRGFGGVFPELTGISQFPFAVEATFAVGPLQVLIDRRTLKTTETGHQHRPRIPKSNGAAVPADTFLDPKFSPISAVWAIDIDETVLIGEARPMVVVHNPYATNDIPKQLLPSDSEYVAIDCGDYLQLNRLPGRLCA